MRLKKLEISGFKTFRDKVVVEFSPGISAVVGPNGCGKSNVIDALRWAMGEQRVKTLRGKKMEDVIFNGAEGAPPVGMAEVTITLVSDGGTFPGAYAQCREVTVTRRLFREEDSEYYINKVPCRLLDVREFFMDTGVGARSYSLVEQNSVSTLVEAKPEERRQYIEDAAGIAKYKSRKEAALRKMEATKQNLLRLNDVMKEVKKQLSVVSRQAKRAEQYKLLKKEIREAELVLALISYSDLTGKKAILEIAKEALESRGTRIDTEMRVKEAAFEELKLATLDDEKVLADCQEKLYAAKNTIAMKEQWIEFSRSKITDMAAHKERDQAEIEARRTKLLEMAHETEILQRTLSETDKEIAEVREALQANRTKLESLKKTDKFFSDGLEAKKVAFIDMIAEKSRLKNSEANLAKVLEDIDKRKERFSKEAEENKKRCDTLLQTLEEIDLNLKKDEGNREELAMRHDLLTRMAEEERNNLKQIEEKVAALKEEHGRKSALLFSLQKFHEGYAWCSEGIKSIMTAKKDGRLGEMTGGELLGLVADHIDVPIHYETAVEAVLGEKLQYVIVKSQEEGVKAIDYLKSSAKGRGTFVPLAVRNHDAGRPLAEHLREAVRLADHVRIHDDYKDVLTYLLGDVLLIPNLNAGLSLWRQNGFRGTFVTPEGDIINPQGILTGGSHAKEEKGLLADKRKMSELKSNLAGINRELNKAQADRSKTHTLITQAEEELKEIKTKIHLLDIQVNGKRKDLERFEDELKRTNQRLDILEFDGGLLENEEKETIVKLDQIKKDHVLHQEREQIINVEMTKLKEDQDNLRRELGECERAFTASNVLLAAREGKKEADCKNLLKLESSRAALQKEIADKLKEVKTSVLQAEELASRLTIEHKALETLYQNYQILEKEQAEKKTKQQEKVELLRTWEREVREMKSSHEQVRKETNHKEMALRETLFQMEALKNSLMNRHAADLDTLLDGYSPLEEEQIKELTTKLEKSQSTLENFGEVNLLALSEHEELAERYDFLSTQYDDVNASLHSLQRTIERINSISKKRFAETFEAVNACFMEMFAQIFPGGKGRLSLVDSSDMLETGVDIDIRIPGKRTQNITLLSGGEKSLAAIALIFAILRYRPAPFLLLDEVDAALDDANVSLFNRLICDVALNSQVVIITHNKKTMEVAENLFGITMQNQSISTLVSISLN